MDVHDPSLLSVYAFGRTKKIRFILLCRSVFARNGLLWNRYMAIFRVCERILVSEKEISIMKWGYYLKLILLNKFMEENPSFESAHVIKEFLVLIVPCGKHILTLTSLLHNPVHSTSPLHISQTSILVLSSHVFHAVAQFVEALRYKPEGRGFDSRWGPMEFFIVSILTDSAS